MSIIFRSLLATLFVAATTASSVVAQTAPAVLDQRVIFTLVDGTDIHGRIVGPASALQPGAAVSSATLYLHGFGHGDYIWTFDAVPGYDFATEMARLGHVSIVVDRLGYDQSTHPIGMATSMDLQVRSAHQLVSQLKASSYKTPNGSGPWRVGRVALAGLSAGGGIAEAETWQYRDTDALVVMGWNDNLFGQGAPVTLGAFNQMLPLCLDPTRSGYEYFGQQPSDYQAINFAPGDTDPLVAAAATKLRNPDACGDALSVPALAGANMQMVSSIQVPTLLVWGTADATFQPSAPQSQRALYGTNATLVMIPGAGHLLPLERSAPVFRAQLAAWLDSRGF